MRPIRLELEGFTSFRERCELQFADLDLFAITGPTGAGKSSLLDAMTYALFGRTARLGKTGTARELVSQGSTSMFVSLEFRAGSEVYRIHRGLKGSTAKGQLAKWSAGGEWVSETGSIREIDVAVRRIVGLDFEGFTRAVILPQGKFDEFLRGDVKQRREVLKDLLDLQIFEKMMQAANAKAQSFSADARRLDSQIEADITDDTKREIEKSITDLEAKEAEQAELIGKLEHGQTIAEELAAHRTREQTYRKDLEAAEKECSRLKSELEKLEALLQEKRRALAEVDKAIAVLAYDPNEHLRISQLIPKVHRLAVLNTDIGQLEGKHALHAKALQTDSSKLEEANAAWDEAIKSSRQAEETLQAAKASLESLLHRYGLPQAVRSLGPEINGMAAKQGELQALQAEIDALQSKLSNKQKVLQELAAARDEAETVRNAAEKHLEHLAKKHSAAELRHNLRPGEPCPVCEQKVTALPPVIAVTDLQDAKRAHKQAQARFEEANTAFRTAPGEFAITEKEIEHKAESRQRLSDAITSVRERVRNILGAEPGEHSIEQLEKLASSIEEAQKETERLEDEWRAGVQAESQCRTKAESLKVRCAGHRERLEDGSQQVQRLQTERADLERELSGIPEPSFLEKQFKVFEQAKKERERLDKQRAEAERVVNQSQSEKASLSGRIGSETTRSQKAKTDLEQTIEQVAEAERRLQTAIAPLELPKGSELETLKQELKAANNLLRKMESERRAKQVRLDAVLQTLKKNQELEKQSKELRQSAAVYHELGILLSADHFQDYMLRSSYRLLAREGSRYFADLTGGRYSFHSDQDQFSVRDHSNGDELRSVSTLSGGESFLASLSLALALAQSIVELSGERGAVALESLFLDEGFSTLDPETLGKVADALPALQKKGRLIGVITHVESLAEQLPARIEITKTPTGSRILQSRVVLEATATTA